MLVRDARARYFAQNGFSEASYRDRFTRIPLGPISLPMWNPPSRQRAVALHDVHHVATGYATTWSGEAEIGAWEIAAGCGEFAAAWIYDAAAMAFGVAICPRRTFRAFVRGRRARSLYAGERRVDDVLDLHVDELCALLQLDRDRAPATWRDYVAFAIALPRALVGAVASAFS
ncbi:MAG TPA: hypothetical protein VH143_11240 [Kofleriaceae bacterium]|jgi:hypothetical protein|nr:hypothetical protein [Kofleriaceae bacterium]